MKRARGAVGGAPVSAEIQVILNEKIEASVWPRSKTVAQTDKSIRWQIYTPVGSGIEADIGLVILYDSLEDKKRDCPTYPSYLQPGHYESGSWTFDFIEDHEPKKETSLIYSLVLSAVGHGEFTLDDEDPQLVIEPRGPSSGSRPGCLRSLRRYRLWKS